ncbi:MAG: hypothetical protein JSR17_10920 [Proteobacteria bacterium]|nr:hypothetical protein [Pseudomonadota bacterium]
MQTAKQSTKRTTHENANMQTEIPQELLPYFNALADCSKQKDWITQVYVEKIIPYIDNLVKKDTFYKNALTIDDLIILKAYYFKQKSNYSQIERQRLIHLRNGVKLCDKLLLEIENSFFSSIYHKKHGFAIDSFLPSNVKKHLQFILEVQLLIFIQNELMTLNKNTNEQKAIEKITALQKWVRRELDCKKPDKPATTSHQEHLISVKPNTYLYFLNGSQHLFIMYQLEYLNLRKLVVNWMDWKDYFEKNNLNVKDLLSFFATSIFNLAINLFLLTFLPYRLLRTIVNQLSDNIAVEIKNILMRKFPFVTKWKIWHPTSFLFQIGIYLGLTMLFGLPMLPLPLVALPDLISSFHLLCIPACYCASIFFAVAFNKLFKNEDKQLNDIHAIVKTQAEEQITTTPLLARTKPSIIPLYDRYFIQHDDIDALSKHPSSVNLLPTHKKRS